MSGYSTVDDKRFVENPFHRRQFSNSTGLKTMRFLCNRNSVGDIFKCTLTCFDEGRDAS